MAILKNKTKLRIMDIQLYPSQLLYHEKKAEGMNTEDFVDYFTQKYLVDISRSKWNLMPEKKTSFSHSKVRRDSMTILRLSSRRPESHTW